jgi:hypothetical protein
MGRRRRFLSAALIWWALITGSVLAVELMMMSAW